MSGRHLHTIVYFKEIYHFTRVLNISLPQSFQSKQTQLDGNELLNTKCNFPNILIRMKHVGPTARYPHCTSRQYDWLRLQMRQQKVAADSCDTCMPFYTRWSIWVINLSSWSVLRKGYRENSLLVTILVGVVTNTNAWSYSDRTQMEMQSFVRYFKISWMKGQYNL